MIDVDFLYHHQSNHYSHHQWPYKYKTFEVKFYISVHTCNPISFPNCKFQSKIVTKWKSPCAPLITWLSQIDSIYALIVLSKTMCTTQSTYKTLSIVHMKFQTTRLLYTFHHFRSLLANPQPNSCSSKICTPKTYRMSNFGASSTGFAMKSNIGVLANGFQRC
jgi:hypothetical protein